MTIGELMLIGGIAGAIVFSLVLIILLATAGKKRKKLIDRIQQEM